MHTSVEVFFNTSFSRRECSAHTRNFSIFGKRGGIRVTFKTDDSASQDIVDVFIWGPNWCQKCGFKMQFPFSVANNGKICSWVLGVPRDHHSNARVEHVSGIILPWMPACLRSVKHNSLRSTDLSQLDYFYCLLYVWILYYVLWMVRVTLWGSRKSPQTQTKTKCNWFGF